MSFSLFPHDLPEYLADELEKKWATLSMATSLSRRRVLADAIREALAQRQTAGGPFDDVISTIIPPGPALQTPPTPGVHPGDFPVLPDEGLNPRTPREL